MARKNATISITVADDNSAIQFHVIGQTEPLNLTVGTLTDEVRVRAMMHGLIQKVSDAAALSKNSDGSSAEPADKFAAMAAIIERLNEGDWKRRASDGTTQPSGLIFRAYVAVVTAASKKAKRDVPAESVLRELYDRKDRSAQLALRNNPDIAAEITRLKSETGAVATVNTDSLMDELAGL